MTEQPRKNRPQMHPADSYACPVCVGKHFIWGQASAMGGWLGLKVPSQHQQSSGFGKPLRARACERCGNVLFFVDPAQLED